jgi:uncharacterized protein (TIGR02145 family)
MKTKIFISLFAFAAFTKLLAQIPSKGKNKITAVQQKYAPKDSLTNTEIKIGEQVWSPQNLNVGKFRNGDDILNANTPEKWIKACEGKLPAWAYYGNDSLNGQKYGKLYNYWAVSDTRGLAPENWRVSSEEDWLKLANAFGGINKAGQSLKSDLLWMGINDKMYTSAEDSVRPNNSSKFSALPAGWMDTGGDFQEVESKATWMTSSIDKKSSTSVVLITMVNGENKIWFESHSINIPGWCRGYSVRCVK